MVAERRQGGEKGASWLSTQCISGLNGNDWNIHSTDCGHCIRMGFGLHVGNGAGGRESHSQACYVHQRNQAETCEKEEAKRDKAQPALRAGQL